MIIDLHCDLLAYLELDERRTPYDPLSRCSLEQMQKGGVTKQVLVIFTENKPGSSKCGARQAKIFKTLPQTDNLQLIPALESACGIAEEKDPLDQVLTRLETLQKEIGPLAYISLTWNEENRFGGGSYTSIGLKPDGKILLEKMTELQIPLDFSHTSDALAYDLFSYIEEKNLSLPVLASHSNFRSVTDNPRNLPNDLALEIAKRNGLIGMNFYRQFVGPTPDYFLKHIEHAKELGILENIALGADFFGGLELPWLLPSPFFPGFNNSSCYPRYLKLLSTILTSEEITQICSSSLIFK
ncbi:MAG: membrane dipeptidase [Candidatus Algichlamydia australiensis]|nr:membrane dipeptidase [Chlamydiales bacterium]